MMKKIFIASDHAGFELKEYLKGFLADKDLEVEDLGCDNEESVDYPEYGRKLAELVAGDEGTRGILICGTGVGMSITANRVSGVRASLCSEPLSAKLTRL
ncbi:MAG: RpiB/LacA/LacB family sugar-phosphate isomerase, partial [Deltaproteobacteria bacterium]|nr:RpiB/LacA/LacB family sugar-phosphate isomerase [Deltaproteobacteria bacterium]